MRLQLQLQLSLVLVFGKDNVAVIEELRVEDQLEFTDLLGVVVVGRDDYVKVTRTKERRNMRQMMRLRLQ